MSEENPRRLLDDPSVEARLRRDLANARTHDAGYDLQAGLRTLSVALDGIESGSLVDTGAGRGAELASTSSPGAEWTASLRAIGAKWWGWSAAGVASVGAIWWVQLSPANTAQPRTASTKTSAQVEPAELAPKPVRATPARSLKSVQAAAAESPARPEPAPSGAVTPAPGASSAPTRWAARPAGSLPEVRAARTATPPASPEHRASSSRESQAAGASQTGAAPSSRPPEIQATHPAEVEHLARVRRLLPADPERALAAAREGQKRFAHGLFTEERAALIVFALARLGRSQDTLHAARSFLLDYPSGPFVARVREIATELEERSP